MGYTKKAIVWLVVLGSLVWLTTATAKTGKDGKGSDDTTQGSGNSGHGNGNSGSGNSGSGTTGTTGPTGATGPSGSTGKGGDNSGKGSDNSGKGSDNSGNTGKGDSSEPESGSSMGVKSSGKVMVKLPGADSAKPLDGSQTIPMDSLVDARNGKVELTTAVDAQGHTQTATFWGASFRVHQRHGYTEIRLAGRRPSCPAAGSAQIARRKKPKTHSLWAHDNHGRYRTRGQNSVATVRGTTWVTQERCDGTLTRVIHGAVVVKDRHTRGKVVVRAGHRFLARSPKTD